MRVMVIGASPNRAKYGNKAVRAYMRHAHQVFAVNRTGESVEGAPGFRNVRDVPGPIDRATLYVPPEVGVAILCELAARGDVRELWVNPGAESDELMAEAERLKLNPVYGCSILDIGELPD